MAHSTSPCLSKRMLLIFVSLWVTRVGIVPSSTFDQNESISSRRDSIQPISSARSFTRPAASRRSASSHCTKRWRMLWKPLIVSEVRQLGLELADALAALAGQFRGVGLVVGDRVADENRNGPIFALCVHVIELSVAGRNHGHRLASGVAPGGCDAAADMIRHFADVLHHGRNVGKDALVFALEDVIRRIARRADDERVVDESLAQRVDCRDSAFQRELRRYFL